MKKQILFFNLMFFFMITTSANIACAQNASDETQIRKVVSTMKDAWNAGNGEMFASVFADDHDYIVWTGMFHPNLSREDNAKQHQQIFDTFYRNTKMENEVSKIKMIREDLVLVYYFSRIWLESLSEPKDWKVLTSILVEKQEDQWLIISFHNSDLEKGTGPEAGAYYGKQEVSIKDKVNALSLAWNGRDAKALAALFVDGYDHVVANTPWMTDFNRQACQEAHEYLFQTVYTKPGTSKVKNIKVQFLKADVALVHVELEDDAIEGNQQELLTLVFEMDNYENWLIRSFNLTPVIAKKMTKPSRQVKE